MVFNKSYKKEISAIDDLIKAKIYVNPQRSEELRKLQEDIWSQEAELSDSPCTLLCINVSQGIVDALQGLPGYVLQVERLSADPSAPAYKADRKLFVKLFGGDALRKANVGAIIHQLSGQDDQLTKLDRRVVALSLLNQLPVLAVATLEAPSTSPLPEQETTEPSTATSPSPEAEAAPAIAEAGCSAAVLGGNTAVDGSSDGGQCNGIGKGAASSDAGDGSGNTNPAAVAAVAGAGGGGGLHALPAASAASGGTWPVFFIPHAEHVGPLKEWLVSELPRVRALSARIGSQLQERVGHLGRINAPLHFLKRASVALVPFGVLTVNFLGVVRVMASMLQLAGMRGDNSANKALGLLGAQNAAMVTAIDSMGDIYSFAIFATVLADFQAMGLVEGVAALDIVDGLTLGSIGVVTGAVSALGAYLTRPLIVRAGANFLAGLQTMHTLNPALRRESAKREKQPRRKWGCKVKGKGGEEARKEGDGAGLERSKGVLASAASVELVAGEAAAVGDEEEGVRAKEDVDDDDGTSSKGPETSDDSSSEGEEVADEEEGQDGGALAAGANTEEGLQEGGHTLTRAEQRQQAAAQKKAAVEAKRAAKEARAAAKAAEKAEKRAAKLAEKERKHREKQEEKERRAEEKAAAVRAKAEEKAAAAQRRAEEKAAARLAKEGARERAVQEKGSVLGAAAAAGEEGGSGEGSKGEEEVKARWWQRKKKAATAVPEEAAAVAGASGKTSSDGTTSGSEDESGEQGGGGEAVDEEAAAEQEAVEAAAAREARMGLDEDKIRALMEFLSLPDEEVYDTSNGNGNGKGDSGEQR